MPKRSFLRQQFFNFSASWRSRGPNHSYTTGVTARQTQRRAAPRVTSSSYCRNKWPPERPAASTLHCLATSWALIAFSNLAKSQCPSSTSRGQAANQMSLSSLSRNLSNRLGTVSKSIWWVIISKIATNLESYESFVWSCLEITTFDVFLHSAKGMALY